MNPGLDVKKSPVKKSDSSEHCYVAVLIIFIIAAILLTYT